MARIVMTIVATAIFVAFSLSNTQHVEVSFVVGRPIEVRLIFLLLITFGSGIVATVFHRLLTDASRRAQHRRIRLQLMRANQQRELAE
jgi:uncharacterized integral membrane protein